MKLRLVFAWYDLWVGAYYDRAKRRLYLMVPMVGVCIEWKQSESATAHLGEPSSCAYVRGYGMVHTLTCQCESRNHATGGGCACEGLHTEEELWVGGE